MMRWRLIAPLLLLPAAAHADEVVAIGGHIYEHCIEIDDMEEPYCFLESQTPTGTTLLVTEANAEKVRNTPWDGPIAPPVKVVSSDAYFAVRAVSQGGFLYEVDRHGSTVEVSPFAPSIQFHEGAFSHAGIPVKAISHEPKNECALSIVGGFMKGFVLGFMAGSARGEKAGTVASVAMGFGTGVIAGIGAAMENAAGHCGGGGGCTAPASEKSLNAEGRPAETIEIDTADHDDDGDVSGDDDDDDDGKNTGTDSNVSRPNPDGDGDGSDGPVRPHLPGTAIARVALRPTISAMFRLTPAMALRGVR